MASVSYFVVCIQSSEGYLMRQPKDGPWPAFGPDVLDAVKFQDDREAATWAREKRLYGVKLVSVPSYLLKPQT